MPPILGFQSFRIIDRNANDQFDAGDQIQLPNGLPLDAHSPQVKAALSEIGISRFEDVSSLFLASVYWNGLQEMDRKTLAGSPLAQNSIESLEGLAKEGKFFWDASRAETWNRDDLRSTFHRTIKLAQCLATTLQMQWCLPSTKSDLEFENPPLRLSNVRSLLERARDLALDPSLRSESLFKPSEASRIENLAVETQAVSLQTLLRDVPRRILNGASPEEMVEIFQASRQDLDPRSISPAARLILENESDWMDKVANPRARVERALRHGGDLESALLDLFQDSSVPPDYYLKTLGSAFGKVKALRQQGRLGRVLEIFNSAELVAFHFPNLSSQIHDLQAVAGTLKEAVKEDINRQVASVKVAAREGDYVEFQNHLLYAILKPSEVSLLHEECVQRSLLKELAQLDRLASQGKIFQTTEIFNLPFFAGKLSYYPGFPKKHFSTSKPDRHQIERGYYWTMVAADSLSRSKNGSASGTDLQRNFRELDALLALAKFFKEQGAALGLKLGDPTRAEQILHRHFALIFPLGMEQADRDAKKGWLETVEETLVILRQRSQLPELMGSSIFDPKEAERILDEALRNGISRAFREAESAARYQDRPETARLLQKAIDYSKRAGVPFDEVRYTRVLSLLQ